MQASPQPALMQAPAKQIYLLPQVESLSAPPAGMVLGRSRSPYSTIWRMLGLVLISFFLMNLLVAIPFGMVQNEPSLSLFGALCSLPLLLLFIQARKPKLVHVMVAEPSTEGNNAHPLPGGRTLTTPMPTRFRHHLLRDSTLLDMPTTSNLWLIFAITLAASVSLFIMMLAQPGNNTLLLLAIFIGIPCWLVGFAVPVFAWWSYSTRSLGLPTRRHEAEAVLTAGFVSTFPAVVINSVLFPLLLMVVGIDQASELAEFIIVTISAPIGEELCKAAAVLCCYRYIDSPRRGFQVGFTVGLGFAMLENILYITGSFTEGFATFAVVAFLRGIGSIPGHAVWTGLSGLGIGWLLSRRPSLGGLLPEKSKGIDADFVLIDSKTGQMVHDATGAANQPAFGNLRLWNTQGYLNPSTPDVQKSVWRLPTTAWTGIGLAILGHAFWNGSTTLVVLLVDNLAGEVAAILAMLGWTLMMIGILLWAARNIMRSLHSVPSSVDKDLN